MKAEESRKSRQRSLTNRFGKHVHIAVKCFIVIVKVHNASSAFLNRQTKTAQRSDKLNFIGFTNFGFVSFVISLFN